MLGRDADAMRTPRYHGESSASSGGRHPQNGGWTSRIKGSRDVIETTVWYLRRIGNWNGHAGTHAPENRPHGRGAARRGVGRAALRAHDRARPHDGLAARGPSEPDARRRRPMRVRGHEPVREPQPSSGPGEDFERYPRDERRDAELAAAAGVDLLFAPPPEEVYPDGFSTSVEVAGLTDVLCAAPGEPRPRPLHRGRDGRREAPRHVRAGCGLLRSEGLSAVACDPPPRARSEHPRAHRGLPHRPGARRPGAQLPQRVPRHRAARARREPEPRARRSGAGGAARRHPRAGPRHRTRRAGRSRDRPGVRGGAARR